MRYVLCSHCGNRMYHSDGKCFKCGRTRKPDDITADATPTTFSTSETNTYTPTNDSCSNTDSGSSDSDGGGGGGGGD